MSDSSYNKRRHRDDSSSRRSKRSRNSSKDIRKIQEKVVKKAVYSEIDPKDFEVELNKRREYVKMFEMKKAGLTSDERSLNCPYLDTINRSVLDFDFEKLCSISLTHLNVYACLVCGLYFQGRGTNTHAHIHSVDRDHHVFLNLQTHRFYCLPDNYEIIDNSLDDITYLLSPTFSNKQISSLDKNHIVRAYNGTSYYPGFVGLNNIKANDYCNVIIQMLSHVKPIRNFFLKENNYDYVSNAASNQNTILVQRFGELIRKLWNPRNFKRHVSPHEFLQAVVLCSKKRFQFTVQNNAIDFFTWIVNTLHTTIKTYKPPNSGGTIFGRAFRGKMKIVTRKIIPDNVTPTEYRRLEQLEEYQEFEEHSKFFMLTCDLPPPPLFKVEVESCEIPQIELSALLAKFNGVQEKEYKQYRAPVMKRFIVEKLPPYLVICFKRFVKNIFNNEKYPTIVTFPLSKFDFGDLLSDANRRLHKHTVYDLISNVSFEGSLEAGSYKIHVLHDATETWNCLQDLDVKDAPQMIPLFETIIQVWRVNTDLPPNPNFCPPSVNT